MTGSPELTDPHEAENIDKHDKVPRTQPLILPMTAISSIQTTVIRHAPIPHPGPHHKKSLSRRLNLHTADTKQQPRPIPTYSTSHILADIEKTNPQLHFYTEHYDTPPCLKVPPHLTSPQPRRYLTIHPSSSPSQKARPFRNIRLHTPHIIRIPFVPWRYMKNHKHLA